jgi:hypothetical protein
MAQADHRKLAGINRHFDGASVNAGKLYRNQNFGVGFEDINEASSMTIVNSIGADINCGDGIGAGD